MEKFIIALQVYFDKNVKKIPERMIITKTIYKYAKFERISTKETLAYDTRLYNDIILDLATDKNVLETGELFYILKKLNQLLISNPSSKLMIDFKNVVKTLSIYQKNDFKKAFLAVNNGRFNSLYHINKNILPFITDKKYYKKGLLEEISMLPENRCILLKKLFDEKYDSLKNYLLEIAKVVSEYQSDTRLENACWWMTNTNILTVNDKMHGKTLETFDHFKNHHDQKQLFSCLNLWKTK